MNIHRLSDLIAEIEEEMPLLCDYPYYNHLIVLQ